MEHNQDQSQADQNDAGSQSHQPGGESGTLALSVDDFSSLEDRILRAVNLVKRERLARSAAEERASHAEAKLNEQTLVIEQLQKDIATLHAERDHVRQRVEKLLAQLDTLEL
jgi:chromosome segregation ATPase